MIGKWKDALGEPRVIGVAGAVTATLLGLAYLAAAGAPARYLVVNAAALALGLVALGGIDRAALCGRRSSGAAVALLGAALLATALLGTAADGAARWIWVGPLSVQPSLVLLPFMLVCFAARSDRLATAGMAIAALALALQPDRAMAGTLFLGLAALATARRDIHSLTALAAAAAAFAATLARSDSLPAVPYVDRILYTAFDVHPLAGAAVLLGAGLLFLPAVAGRRKSGDRGVRRAFGALWIGIVAAAALGNYPTPVVGYGGSAILGYLLSLAAFPPALRGRSSPAAESAGTADGPAGPLERRAGLAA